jgi:endoribonuclease LACTB2
MDHVGGISDILALSDSNNPMAIHKHKPTYDPYKQVSAHIDPSEIKPISHNETFRTPSGFEVRALYTPGHTQDHMCFLVTSSPDASEIGAIFTADNVLGHGTAVFEDLTAYISSLHIMKDALPHDTPVKAYPGHGAVIGDAHAKIAEYIEHRHMREMEALNVLKYGTPTPPPADSESEAAEGGLEVVTGKEWGSMEMVKVIYRHYPENLWEPAEKGLLMVLDKLAKEGRVERAEQGGWVLLDKAAL